MSIIEIKVPEDNEEGTTMKIQKWLKSVGDKVSKDEPLVEIETDKVTMEIEAPDDGILSTISCDIGEDVEAGAVIGKLSTDSTVGAGDEVLASEETPIQPVTSAPSPDLSKAANLGLSPSVRRLVAKHDLDVSTVEGTGKGGRLTLADVKSYHAKGTAKPKQPGSANVAFGDQMISHSNMRQSIAKHMSHSVATAPHVTAVFELDFTAIMAHRAANKGAFAAKGVKLTYTAYFIMACVEAMKVAPSVNSRWHDDKLQIFGDVNIGVGTSLGTEGLVVPVIQKTQDKDLFETAQNLQDVIDRARENKLKPTDVKGGTFTTSNHGVSGSLIASPIIINQPQSAILGVGKLEKRVVVKTIEGQDAMVIKPMAFVSLTIDHRVLDGHQTNTWLSTFVECLENWQDNKA